MKALAPSEFELGRSGVTLPYRSLTSAASVFAGRSAAAKAAAADSGSPPAADAAEGAKDEPGAEADAAEPTGLGWKGGWKVMYVWFIYDCCACM